MALKQRFNKYFSNQAKLALVGYALLSISFFLPVNNPNEPPQEYNLSERLLSFIVMLLPITISVYTINCMVVGTERGGMPCNVLAWLNSASVFVWCGLILLFTLLLLNSNGKGNGNGNGTEQFSSCGVDRRQ